MKSIPIRNGEFHFTIRIPQTEEPGRLQSMELQESDAIQPLNHHKKEMPREMWLIVSVYLSNMGHKNKLAT